MTHTELQAIEQEINFDHISMALCLGLAYRTFQNYYYGINKIPADVERKVLELLQINKTFASEAPARIDAEINKRHPFGVPNEVRE